MKTAPRPANAWDSSGVPKGQLMKRLAVSHSRRTRRYSLACHAPLAPRAAKFAPSRSLQLPEIYSTHVPSNFRRISNKTNDWVHHQVTQFFRIGLPVSMANRAWEIRRRPAYHRNLQFSNRKLQLLESILTQRKQTIGPRPNRKFSRVAQFGANRSRAGIRQ